MSNQKGFTFPDVLIGALILSLGIVSVAGMQARATRDIALAESVANAAIVARSIMDELVTAPYVDCVDKKLNRTVGRVEYDVAVQVRERPALSIKEVNLVVSWKEKYSQKYQLTKVKEK